MDLGRSIKILVGGALAVISLGGVPLAIQSGSMARLVLFTLGLFAGIYILGKTAQD